MIPRLLGVQACVLAVVAAAGYAESSPKANPDAVVLAGHARFTILTEELVRMEWSEQAFRDAATLVFSNRHLPVPKFNITKKDKWIEIETDHIKLKYDTESSVSFSDANLDVQVKSISKKLKESVTWKPSLTDKDSKRLYGSLRTLDMTNGSVSLDCNAGGPDTIADSHCTYGLISRSGYVVVDDSLGTELDNDPWPWIVKTTAKPSDKCTAVAKDERRVCGYNVATKEQCDLNGCCFDDEDPLPNGFVCYYGPTAYQDLYFFGHGHNYQKALKDFTIVSGNIPIPPRYAFGVFYSRWWAYNDVDIDEIADQYSIRSIPLDVVVLDMDWHLTFYKNSSSDQSGQPKGWTGYTWNKELFPDPQKFLTHLHSRGIHVTANLHPASGVQPWEDSYEVVAKAMGIDPASGKYVPFDLTNKSFATNWLQYSLGSREAEGIDFWWLDWQQGEDWFSTHNQASPNLNPTIWLNRVFFTNPHHWNNKKRPVLLHRFGGLGNHRYPLGFSGDVVPSWKSLEFQPYFTAMASNLGFTYWSHDIGGFQHGNNPELYTRWIQWGVFSPVLRMHSTKDNESDRRIWKYPNKYYEIMRDYLNLRRVLVPYIYTQARHTFDTGLGIVRGLYFEWPELDEAYSYSHQYAYGDSFLIAPIFEPVENASQVAKKEVWLPPGTWYDMTFGSIIAGPTKYTHAYALNEVPWFAKAGSIVPRAQTHSTSSLGQAQTKPSIISLVVIPGSTHGKGSLYEDSGDSQSYQNGEYSWTSYTYEAIQNQVELTIHPVNGTLARSESHQKYIVEFRHSIPAKSVTVNGHELKFLSFDAPENEDGWKYDGTQLTVRVILQSGVSTTASTSIRVVSISKAFNANLLNGVIGGFSRVQEMKTIIDLQGVYAEDYPNLRLAMGASRRIAYNPSSFSDELTQWPIRLQHAVKEVKALKLSNDVRAHLLALLHDIVLEPSSSPFVSSHDDPILQSLVYLGDDAAESFLST